jgi:hypothetical protein
MKTFNLVKNPYVYFGTCATTNGLKPDFSCYYFLFAGFMVCHATGKKVWVAFNKSYGKFGFETV